MSDDPTGLVAEIALGAWFAACGEPLLAEERTEAAAYLAALGFAGVAIERAAGWEEAARLTQRPDWSHAWWDAESKAADALKPAAVAALGETPLLEALSRVALAAAGLHGAAALAMTGRGHADPALTRVAAGAAGQACHQTALAQAAGAGPDHAFALKYRLFAAGRWPLGIVGETFFVL